MFNDSYITILFKLLNFAALIALFVYIFKKYFLKEIESGISQECKHKSDLEQTIVTLQETSLKLSDNLDNQEKLCHYLNQQLEKWKSAFEKDFKAQQEQKNRVYQEIFKKTEKQARYIAQEHIIHTVVPEALEKARAYLNSSFSSPQQSAAYVGDIIKQLNHIKE